MDVVNTKVQTGLRLDPELYNRLKLIARRENSSFNSYVERILESAAKVEFPRLSANFKVSEDILSLGDTLPHYTKEEIAADARLEYLLSK